MKRKEEISKAAIHYAIERQKDPNYPVYNWENEIYDAFEEGAEWSDKHPQNLWHDAQWNDLPPIDKEVIVLIQKFPDDAEHLEVAFGHRPNPDGEVWKHSDGTLERVHFETYGKGGWNIPDVKWWLNIDIP